MSRFQLSKDPGDIYVGKLMEMGKYEQAEVCAMNPIMDLV